MFDNADQISPLVPMISRLGPPLVEVARLGNREGPRKAVGEDLVENRVANPVGCFRIGHRQLRRACSWRKSTIKLLIPVRSYPEVSAMSVGQSILILSV